MTDTKDPHEYVPDPDDDNEYEAPTQEGDPEFGDAEADDAVDASDDQ